MTTTLTEEFLALVKSNLRPETRDPEVWAALHTDEQVQAFLVALQSIHGDVTRQLAASDSDDPEWVMWRKKAAGFRLHVEDYIRRAELAVATLVEASATTKVAALTAAIEAHRSSLLEEGETPGEADEALWGVLDAA